MAMVIGHGFGHDNGSGH